jgi:hypothetical protein
MVAANFAAAIGCAFDFDFDGCPRNGQPSGGVA